MNELFKGVMFLFLGALFTHLFDWAKIRKENKKDFQNVIGKSKAEALDKLFIVIREARTVETYNINEYLNAGGVLKVDERTMQYPAIMNDFDSLNEFHDLIENIRNNHEQYLDRKVAIHIILMDKYLYNLSTYISSSGKNKLLNERALLFIGDINYWADSLEEQTISDINKCSVVLERKKGKKYDSDREKIFNKLYYNSMLYIMQKEEHLTEAEMKKKEGANELIAMLDMGKEINF